MAHIYDNIEKTFENGLRTMIDNPLVKRTDFCVGYFNLRGWKRIVNEIDQLEGDFVTEFDENRRPVQMLRKCRLLIGMLNTPRDLLKLFYSGEEWLADTETVQRAKLRLALEFREQLLLGYPSKDDEMALRRLSGQMKDGRVTVKLYAKDQLHAKLYLAHRPDDNVKIVGIMGSSNLTYPGLTKQGELNAEFLDSDHVEKLAKWFDDRWNEKFCLDITDELIKVIDNSWAASRTLSPYYIYLKVAYHLSEDARNGIKEFALTPEFQHDLFDFQQNAVKMVVHHLQNEKRHGAMIGDVVGLGKTITACAVAKIYETTFSSSTLIICPANLQEMWRKYVVKYDLKADVMSVAKPIDIENSRFYRLIIVDESHNLRNGGVRYTNIKNLIERQSSHVLLLTATPYNKHYNDLANQLRLFLSDDQDLGLRPERLIETMGSERAFARQYPDVLIRSIGAFMKSDHVEDWNELMKLFLVRRTRSFIKEHYAKTDETNGRKYLQYPDGRRSYFPDRIPKSLKFAIAPGDQFSRLYSNEMMDLMAALELPRYGLGNYINKKEAENAPQSIKKVFNELSAAGSLMMGFCRSTFFKRMDSSGFSFLLSIYRHILRNCVYIHAIENKLELPIGDKNSLPEDYCEDGDNDNGGVFTEDDEGNGVTLNIPTDMAVYMRKAEDYLKLIAGKPNIKWVKPTYFKPSLKKQLKADCELLIKMIKLCGAWEQEKDQKLNLLCDMLNGEHARDKVVVFTQYADTARYIYNQLRKRGFTAIDYATGNSENPTAKVEKFSPKSNDKKLDTAEQTRILIATDVLSEGQNLQDAHIVVNYDLPWAIIRLIQRCGRVDRIGQESEKIWCYSFFPADGVEEIIHLRGRLSERINQNAQTIGSDEIFFEGNEQNLRDMYNEEAGILDENEGDDVDLASYAFQIWSDATKKHPELKRIIPDLQNMVYSTREASPTEKEGVITYARTADDYDVLTWMDAKGDLQTQSQYRILKALECSYGCEGIEPLGCHHEIVAKSMEIIKRQTESAAPTVVGNRLGTRFRILNVLEDFNRRESDLFHTDERKAEVELAINDLYNNQLQTNAKFNLGRMLKRGMDYDEVVDYVLELRKNGQLCVIREDEAAERDNVIICSMGLKHKN